MSSLLHLVLHATPNPILNPNPQPLLHVVLDAARVEVCTSSAHTLGHYMSHVEGHTQKTHTLLLPKTLPQSKLLCFLTFACLASFELLIYKRVACLFIKLTHICCPIHCLTSKCFIKKKERKEKSGGGLVCIWSVVKGLQL